MKHPDFWVEVQGERSGTFQLSRLPFAGLHMSHWHSELKIRDRDSTWAWANELKHGDFVNANNVYCLLLSLDHFLVCCPLSGNVHPETDINGVFHHFWTFGWITNDYEIL